MRINNKLDETLMYVGHCFYFISKIILKFCFKLQYRYTYFSIQTVDVDCLF